MRYKHHDMNLPSVRMFCFPLIKEKLPRIRSWVSQMVIQTEKFGLLQIRHIAEKSRGPSCVCFDWEENCARSEVKLARPLAGFSHSPYRLERKKNQYCHRKTSPKSEGAIQFVMDNFGKNGMLLMSLHCLGETPLKPQTEKQFNCLQEKDISDAGKFCVEIRSFPCLLREPLKGLL